MGSMTALGALDWLVDNGGDRDITRAGHLTATAMKTNLQAPGNTLFTRANGWFGAPSRCADNAEVQQVLSAAWHQQ